MAFKLIFQLCVSVFVLKAVLSQCIPSLGTKNPSNLWASAPFAGNRGVPMVVPSAPIEVSISSDNLIIDGYIDVTGTMPFYSAVVVEGTVPNAGGASAFYECGNGNIGIEPGTGMGAGYKPTLGFNELGCGRV
ncbi:chorion class B protein M2410-like [Hyposmocoma kahamanoa]|uniref:chorion class B protein M2410-like n=1 Tax=Hyposmocoma kahamanoa TaxID=1477025 RepID=UPI000E6D7B5F|nr:chorion class B protein M2410-like [Hyposmocoma kahamanoa]